jgi:hypothetical protein
MRKLTVVALAGLLAVAALAQTRTSDYQVPTTAQVHQPDAYVAAMVDNSIMSQQATVLFADKQLFALMHEHQKVLEHNKGDSWEDRASKPWRSQSSETYLSMINSGTGSGAIARMCADSAIAFVGHYDSMGLGTADSGKEVAYANFTAGKLASGLQAKGVIDERRSQIINHNSGAKYVLLC